MGRRIPRFAASAPIVAALVLAVNSCATNPLPNTSVFMLRSPVVDR